jgi:hypothetical protein
VVRLYKQQVTVDHSIDQSRIRPINYMNTACRPDHASIIESLKCCQLPQSKRAVAIWKCFPALISDKHIQLS